METTAHNPHDFLNTCNACDAAPMAEGDPRGYCTECAEEAAR